jgi:DNA polymerase/3'-5' exonuclease PolX
VYPGIGKAISGVIEEIVQTGKLRQAERMRADIPPEILELTCSAGERRKVDGRPRRASIVIE